jgi:hypothetical protein
MAYSKRTKIIYWTCTILFILPLLASGIAYLCNAPMAVQGIQQLGYPLYLLKILGVAKLLGVSAILYNRLKTLKEWAYAGFTFNLIGAASSHILAGESIEKAVAPLVVLSLMFTSYVFWKKMNE